MALTEAEKSSVRYHLGYMQVSMAPSIQLGIPRPMQTVFLLEQGLNLLQEEHAIANVRNLLLTLSKIEAAMVNALCQLGASKLGDMTLHPLAEHGQLVTDSLRNEYQYWAGRLADVFGVPKYWNAYTNKRVGAGRSVPVRQ